MATALSSRQNAAAPHPRNADRALVVVVAHNGRRYLQDCLESLMMSGVDPAGIVVVDNDSGDGGPELVQAWFPAIHVLCPGTNLGYGAAINLAVAHAMRDGGRWESVEYLAVLNQDVVSGPAWIDHLITALERDRSAALATPKILIRSNPDLVNACGNNVHLTGITTCRGYGRRSLEYAHSSTVTAVSGAAFVIRKRVFDAVGGFDPLFFLYLEDTDLSLRVALAGYRAMCVPDAVVYHDFDPSFAEMKIHWLERNRIVLLAKVYKWRSLLVLLPALMLTELLVLGYAIGRGSAVIGAKARTYAWLARNLPRIRDSRRRAQAQRRISDREMLAHLAPQLDVRELQDRRASSVAALANALYRAWWSVARRVISW